MTILPLGDSLTIGVTDSIDSQQGYRPLLKEALTGIEMVGSQGGHEGHGGLLIEEALNLKLEKADVVLLLIGSNNIYIGQDPEIAFGLLKDLLASLQSRVIISLIPPVKGRDVTRFNEHLRTLENVVDPGFDEKDLCDWIHLTRRGYTKLAIAFYHALCPKPLPLRLRIKWQARVYFVAFKRLCRRSSLITSVYKTIKGRT